MILELIINIIILLQVLYATVSGSECRVTSPIELTLAPLETSPRSRASTKRSSRRIDSMCNITHMSST